LSIHDSGQDISDGPFAGAGVHAGPAASFVASGRGSTHAAARDQFKIWRILP